MATRRLPNDDSLLRCHLLRRRVKLNRSSGEDENVPEQLDDDDDNDDDVVAKTDGQKHKPSHGKR